MDNVKLEAALRLALNAADNILAQLEAHSENIGEHLEPEDQAIVDGAKQDLAQARARLAEKPTLPPCEDCGAPMVQTSHDTWECGADCPGSNGSLPGPDSEVIERVASIIRRMKPATERAAEVLALLNSMKKSDPV